MKWEYFVERVDTWGQSRKILDDRGKEGWELVSVVEDNAGTLLLFFKRPKG